MGRLEVYRKMQALLEEYHRPNVEIVGNKLVSGSTVVLNSLSNKTTLYFYYWKPDEGEFNDSDFRITFPNDFPFEEYIGSSFRTGNYYLKNRQPIFALVNPKGKKITKLTLTNGRSIKQFREREKHLILSIDKFLQLQSEAETIYNKAKKYQNSTRNYLNNKQSHKYTRDIKKRVTFSEKGEFEFLVDKFYPENKTNRKHIMKFLNDNDINSIVKMFELFLTFDLFPTTFLKRLDEQLIKEKLRDIINLGNKILDLRVSDLTTLKARKVLEKLGENPAPRKLEALWQKYFERYLLYLVFTYKSIYPKVELLNINTDKRYPDFIGINHYNGVDVIEIKTHLKNALQWDSSHENYYFSSEMSKAIIQTKNYLDSIRKVQFSNPRAQERIVRDAIEEENLYHPRGIIIISSKDYLSSNMDHEEELTRDFTKLRNSLEDIEILTFNEIIQITESYLGNIVS